MLHKHPKVLEKREKIFNLETFMELVDHDMEFAKHLIEMFAANTPNILQQIRAKREKQQYDQLYSDVHNLKGTIGFFGKREIDDLLADIEKDLTTGVFAERTFANIDILDGKINQLIAEVEAVMEQL